MPIGRSDERLQIESARELLIGPHQEPTDEDHLRVISSFIGPKNSVNQLDAALYYAEENLVSEIPLAAARTSIGLVMISKAAEHTQGKSDSPGERRVRIWLAETGLRSLEQAWLVDGVDEDKDLIGQLYDAALILGKETVENDYIYSKDSPGLRTRAHKLRAGMLEWFADDMDAYPGDTTADAHDILAGLPKTKAIALRKRVLRIGLDAIDPHPDDALVQFLDFVGNGKRQQDLTRSERAETLGRAVEALDRSSRYAIPEVYGPSRFLRPSRVVEAAKPAPFKVNSKKMLAFVRDHIPVDELRDKTFVPALRALHGVLEGEDRVRLEDSLSRKIRGIAFSSEPILSENRLIEQNRSVHYVSDLPKMKRALDTFESIVGSDRAESVRTAIGLSLTHSQARGSRYTP